jgi:hypothetical protein
MKRIVFVFIFLLLVQANRAQEAYPTPPDAHSRLFYIQHNKSTNTFVYDANFSAKKQLNETEPVKVYRLTYTKGGIKEELSNLQRKMAYGVTIIKSSATTCDFILAAYPSKTLQLKLHADGKPYVTVNINGKNIILHKMFLNCNKLGSNVLSIDFYGKDTATGKEIKENFIVKD